jgi:hypothetical protein
MADPAATHEVEIEEEDIVVASQFTACTTTEGRVESLVTRGFLPRREESHWSVPPAGSTALAPEEGEIVVFTWFFERGLGLLAHPFLRGLLNYYKVELHHLNPTGIAHITAFIAFCKAFVGAEANFALWKYFFHPCVLTSRGEPLFAGGCGLRLRGNRADEYFWMKMADSNKGWRSEWFYVANPQPALPRFSGRFAEKLTHWEWGPDEDERTRWSGPMRGLLRELKDAGLTGVRVMWTFFERRVQPLRARAHPLFRYTGVGDPTRMLPEELSPLEVRTHVWAVIRCPEITPELDDLQAGLAIVPAARHAGYDPDVVSPRRLLSLVLD